MLRALYTSATGLAAQQFNLDIVANNLANASTTGFKASRANFEDLLYQDMRMPGSQTGSNSMLPTGSQVGLGVSQGTTETELSQGTITASGGQYDMAIAGPGYFQILMPDGSTAYTRAGGFNIDGTGRLVNPEGYPTQPEIVFPANSSNPTISASGEVQVTLPGQTTPQTIGQIQLANFLNPAGLVAMGGNNFQVSPASGTPQTAAPGTSGMGTIQSGSLESSNVDIVSEMVKMIVLQRAYDTNSKVIQSADEMLTTTNSIKR